MTAADAAAIAHEAPRNRLQPWWTALASTLLVGAVFVFGLPRIASYDDAWDRLRNLSDGDTAVLLAVAAWNIASYWLLLVVALPGLSLVRAALANEVSTAVANTVPVGGAAGVGITASMYREWGFTPDAIARALVVAGAWNVFVKLATPPVAVILVTWWGVGHPPVGVGFVSIGALVMIVVAFAAVLRDASSVQRIVRGAEAVASHVRGRPMHGWEDGLVRFRASSRELVGRRWPALSATAAVSHVSLFAVLATTMWALGLTGVSILEAFVAFAVIRIALLLPITPGGAGLTELGLAGLLVNAGASRPDALAVVLVFRALTWVLPIPLGGVSYVAWLWQRRRR
jgi:uncharacterized protein (TIRG00374 family)